MERWRGPGHGLRMTGVCWCWGLGEARRSSRELRFGAQARRSSRTVGREGLGGSGARTDRGLEEGSYRAQTRGNYARLLVEKAGGNAECVLHGGFCCRRPRVV